MTLEQRITSLELSKRLKELGVKQESIFVWEYFSETCYGVKFIPFAVVPDKFNCCEHYSAFTSSEIIEMLPKYITKDNTEFYYLQYPSWHCDKWIITYGNSFERWKSKEQEDVIEVNARAKMLIYLLENKLI